VVGICTHLCRKIPGLKLNPRHCEARRNKPKGQIRDVFMSGAGSECLGCPGPIPATECAAPIKRQLPSSIHVPGVIPEGPQVAAPATGRKRKTKPDVCNECGGRVEDGVYFFPSNPYCCANCITARSERNRKKRSSVKRRITVVIEKMAQ